MKLHKLKKYVSSKASKASGGFTPTPQHSVMSRVFYTVSRAYRHTISYINSLHIPKRHKNTTPCLVSGFSIVEMLVSVAVFSIVMLIAVGALTTMIDANRKAQALNSVMNNLNLAIESMSRDIRVGTTYRCESGTNPPPPGLVDTPQDCPGPVGGQLIAFESSKGNPSNPDDQTVYRFFGGQLERSKERGKAGTFVAITAPEVKIEKFMFFVDGTSLSDERQPRVLIIIRGSAGISEKTKTTFNVQTMASQRVPDL
jgi:prepilin-type N-terminal cleavage/methylation domain-containing protein